MQHDCTIAYIDLNNIQNLEIVSYSKKQLTTYIALYIQNYS